MPVAAADRPQRARRTQDERRAASRARLLDAALDCLAEQGYAATTFAAITKRAGLSNGALWRHFRTKNDLLLAASTHSLEQLAATARGYNLDHLPDRERLTAAIDVLWEYAHSTAFHALLELLAASRADEQLRTALVEQDQRMADLFFEAVSRLVGERWAATADFHQVTRLFGLAMYGAALTDRLRTASADERLKREFVAAVQQLLNREA